MFRAVLLLLAVVGLHARPLQDVQRIRKSGWEMKGPTLVQDEHKQDSVRWMSREYSHHSKPLSTNTGLKSTVEKPRSASEDFHRQGTEPSRRVLMDLNTGMLKENVGEMNRRVAGFYNPPADEMRRGTQNSRVILVDFKSGQLLNPLPEMQRRAEPPRLKVVSGPAHEVRPSPFRQEENHKSDPVEFHRQGTEPSRRVLMDLNTGMPKENVGEMNRRVAGFYNPSADEVRQGTQNSRVILVDLRSGKQLNPLSEMQRKAAAHDLSPELHRETQPSRNLMDLNAGQLKEHKNEMDRKATGSKWEVVSGPDHDEDASRHKMNQNPDPVEFHRQGTEPSRRVLMDLNTGMLKENVGEMNRRVAGFYNPSADEVRQGTQNSHAVLVDHKTGQLLNPLSEMQRRAEPLKELRPYIRKDAGEAKDVCPGEIIQGKCYKFDPSPQTFNEAEASCKKLSPEGHLASVTNADVHKRLVTMVNKAKNHPVITWLGGIQKENRFQWIDGSTWGYSDWMPGQPKERKLSCIEMFRFVESWWTSVDCAQKRAFICSYPMTS